MQNSHYNNELLTFVFRKPVKWSFHGFPDSIHNCKFAVVMIINTTQPFYLLFVTYFNARAECQCRAIVPSRLREWH